jgi:hypothetical protein
MTIFGDYEYIITLKKSKSIGKAIFHVNFTMFIAYFHTMWQAIVWPKKVFNNIVFLCPNTITIPEA